MDKTDNNTPGQVPPAVEAAENAALRVMILRLDIQVLTNIIAERAEELGALQPGPGVTKVNTAVNTLLNVILEELSGEAPAGPVINQW